MYDDNAPALISPTGGRLRALGGMNHGLLAAMRFNQHGFRLSSLRPNDTLRRDEWVFFHDVVVEESALRLVGIADLMERGLTFPVANALGKTEIEFEDITDMEDAETSLDGLSRTRMDRVLFSQSRIPNFITHKDFFLTRRVIEASRERGETLPSVSIRTATKKVNEKLEDVLFNGGGPVVHGNRAYGYTNHPDRNILGFSDVPWNEAVTDAEKAAIVTDVLGMKQVLIDDGYGSSPKGIYVGSDMEQVTGEDYKASVSGTILSRLMDIQDIAFIKVSDKLAAGNVVMVALDRDVVELAVGERPQPIQWDFEGGMGVNFKVMAIMVPVIKSTATGKSGIVHLSATS